MSNTESAHAETIEHQLSELDRSYALLHTEKEDAYWVSKMGLADDTVAAQADLDAKALSLAHFLGDPQRLSRVRLLAASADTDEQRTRVAGWLRTLSAHALESAEARAAFDELSALDGAMAQARRDMPLGYSQPAGGFVSASTVELSRLVLMEGDEAKRRAAWEGLRAMEPYLLDHGFLEIIRQRNRLGRLQGGEDYYDWKTRQNEGMTKHELFALLDELEERTRAAAERTLARARAQYGAERVNPWSIAHLLLGDLVREQDPYFPFRAAIERWGRSFAALGIDFQGAELVLDLLERPGKFENGFMHGPVVGWRERGRRIPARIHFTANAMPAKVGSGARALNTLFHEGGHAAHFASIDMPSPCFGQEFAPTSPAFAETQSMFCDSLIADAAWLSRYARNARGELMPMSLIERAIDIEQPTAARTQHSTLAICYAERALYEIPDAELTKDRVLSELLKIERRFNGMQQGGPRAILSVPHLLSGDFSAYFHSYMLAEMAVHQVRDFFLERDGHLIDNPRIGPDLCRVFWQPGNSVAFRQLVKRLTGASLSVEPLARRLNATPEERKGSERAAVQRMADVPLHSRPIELGAKIRIVHGNESVAELEGDFEAFSGAFAAWIDRQLDHRLD